MDGVEQLTLTPVVLAQHHRSGPLGIVMGQRRCDADEAFAVLRQLSQTSNTKLRDVAAQVVLTVSGAPPTPPPPVE